MKVLKLIATLSFILVVYAGYSQKKEWTVFETDHRIVYDVCFTKKGEALIAADGRNIKVFETRSQKLLHEFTNGHTAEILTVDLSDDSTLLVSGGKDSTLVIWDFINQKLLKSVHAHRGAVTSASISPDGRWIASGGTDNRVTLYDLRTHSTNHQFTDHSDDVTSVEFSNDGSLLATASADKTIKIYELSTLTLIASLSGHSDWVRDLSFSDDGKKLVSCGDDRRVIIWNITDIRHINPQASAKVGLNWLLSVDINIDNTTYAVGDVNGNASISGTFGKYSESIRIPIHRLLFKPGEGSSLKIVVATRGKGVFMMHAKDMK